MFVAKQVHQIFELHRSGPVIFNIETTNQKSSLFKFIPNSIFVTLQE